MIYLILAIIILIIICFFSIKSNFKSSKKAKEQKMYIDKITDVLFENNKIENDKTDIREESNEIKNNIINGNTSVILPNDTKPKHNHSFSSPCGKGCPAYSGK